jgi:hypothetical protein
VGAHQFRRLYLSFAEARLCFVETGGPSLVADVVEYAGLPADKAAQVATVPDGYELLPFAAEPDIINPISSRSMIARGWWVVEGMTYPNRARTAKGKDRILVFEDTNGTANSTSATVFMEKLNLVSGIEVGYGACTWEQRRICISFREELGQPRAGRRARGAAGWLGFPGTRTRP